MNRLFPALFAFILSLHGNAALAQGAGSSGGGNDARTTSCAEIVLGMAISAGDINAAKDGLHRTCLFYDDEIDCLIAARNAGPLSDSNFKNCITDIFDGEPSK